MTMEQYYNLKTSFITIHYLDGTDETAYLCDLPCAINLPNVDYIFEQKTGVVLYAHDCEVPRN